MRRRSLDMAWFGLAIALLVLGWLWPLAFADAPGLARATPRPVLWVLSVAALLVGAWRRWPVLEAPRCVRCGREIPGRACATCGAA